MNEKTCVAVIYGVNFSDHLMSLRDAPFEATLAPALLSVYSVPVVVSVSVHGVAASE